MFYSGSQTDSFSYHGLLDLGGQDFGYMMECPNYYEEGGAGVLFFSPIGIPGGNKYDYQNVFSVVYCVGDPLDTLNGRCPNWKRCAVNLCLFRRRCSYPMAASSWRRTLARASPL